MASAGEHSAARSPDIFHPSVQACYQHPMPAAHTHNRSLSTEDLQHMHCRSGGFLLQPGHCQPGKLEMRVSNELCIGECQRVIGNSMIRSLLLPMSWF